MKRTIKSALAATFLIAAASTAVGSPLHLYTRMGDSKSVQRYLDNGYDPNVREVDGEGVYTPLHEAAFRCTAKIAELLLRHGAEVDAPVVGGDTPFGFTALHIAAAAGSHAVAEVLLEHGADPNAVANDGERIFTPWPVQFRGIGAHAKADGSADVRGFQTGVEAEMLRFERSLLMESSIANSSIRRDVAGNPALLRAHGRIDPLQAGVQAVAAGVRYSGRPVKRVFLGAV